MPASKMGRRLGSITGAFAVLTALVSSTSAIPFGVQIYSCTTPGVIAPAFDDGPWIYSEDILDRYKNSKMRFCAPLWRSGLLEWKQRGLHRRGSSTEVTRATYTITTLPYTGWLAWAIKLGRIRKDHFNLPPYTTA